MADDLGFGNAVTGASTVARTGAFLLAGGSILSFTYFGTGDLRTTIIVGMGFLVVLLMLLLYFWILKLMQRRKSRPMEQGILDNSGATPNSISGLQSRGRLDDLRKSFEGGVQRFREAGKNIYSLPWYVLVGEPGSGKTEGIRHSKIGFPPGFQDQLQGSGGTLNMNWWFSNNAIILDTAGKLMFEEAPPGQTTEWREFLGLLAKSRPNCPINGLLLVIPSDSLIRDNADQLERKAGKIAKQFDNIQRTLGVRFPVFVVIAKADLIVGFREFFDSVTDPHLQDQIMGWSNPNSLDTPFNPAEVQKHLETVAGALCKRRQGLLLDPVHTEDPNGRRLDQVDALYAFPESLMQIAPRLRRYLEMIFVAGEWAPKPLFLRGIYFNSAMREGSALDLALAEAMKVPLESLPDGRAWERDRSYFLRDLFLEKVFREKGLVTRAGNTKKLQRGRKLAVIITGLVAILALAGLTFLGQHELRKAVGAEYNAWGSVKTGQLSTKVEMPGATPETKEIRCLPLLVPDDKSPQNTTATTRSQARLFRYAGGDTVLDGKDAVTIDGKPQNRVSLLVAAREYASRPTEVSWIFKPISAAIGDINAKKFDAYRRLVDDAVVWPALDATRRKIRLEKPETWSPQAATALGDLVRVETLSSGLVPAMGAKPVLTGPGEVQLKVENMFAYVIEGPDVSTYNGQKDELQRLFDSVYGTMSDRKDAPGKRPPADKAALEADRKAIESGLQTLNDHWQIESIGNRECLGRISDLTVALKRIRAAEKEIEINVGQVPVSMQDYDDRSQKWLKALAEYELAQKEADRLVALIKTYGWDDSQPLRELFDKQLKASLKSGQDGIDGILQQLPVVDTTKKMPEFLMKLRAALEDIKSRLAGLDTAKALAALKLQEDIDKLDGDYLKMAVDKEGKPLRLYGLKQLIYSMAIKPIERDKDKIDPKKGIETVTETLEGVTRELAVDKTRNDETLAKNAAFSAVLKTAVDNSARVVDYRSAAQRQRVCASILAGFAAATTNPATADARNVFGARVMALAQQTEKYPPLRHDQLPFTKLVEAGRFDDVYLPQAAVAVMTGWRTIEATLSDDAKSAARVIDPKPLLERMAELRPQQGKYLDKYRDYWAKEVPASLVVREFTWDDFLKGKLNAVELVTSLLDISKQQNAALDKDALFSKEDRLKPEIRKPIDLTADPGKAVEERLQEDVYKRLISWRRAPDPGKARSAIVVMKPDKFMDGYMLVPPPPGEAQPVYKAYFTQLFIKALEALGKEAQDLLQADLKKLFRDYRRFPLARPDVDMDPLTPDQVVEARKLADSVASAPAGAVSGTSGGSLIQEGAGTNVRDIDDRLKALYSTDITDKDQAVLQKMRRLLDIMPQGEDKLKVSLLTVSTDDWTKALQAGGYIKDDDKWNYVALYPMNVVGGEKDDATVGSQLRVANESINVDALPGKPFRLHLKQNPANTYLNSPCVLPARGVKDRSWNGQWSALRMIFETGAVGDGGEWLVPIPTQGKDAVVIKVKFDVKPGKPIPKTDDWPTTK